MPSAPSRTRASGPRNGPPPAGPPPRGFWRSPLLPPVFLALGLTGFLPALLRDLGRDGADPLHHAARFLAWTGPFAAALFFRAGRLGRLAILTTVAASGWLIWLALNLRAHPDVASMNPSGEPSAPAAYYTLLLLVSLLFLSPVALLLLYRRATLLDRYLLANCIAPFLFCLVAFFAIWLVFDLNDNLPDFRKGDVSFVQILGFYGAQIPLVFNQISQPVLLISTVFALSRMSKANEIVSMLGMGRSLFRILLPLFLFGLYVTFVSTVFSYQWAPWAEGHKESLLGQFKRAERQSTIAERQLFVNREDQRTWYIGQIPFLLDREELRLIDIFELDAEGRIRRSLQAAAASWRWRDATWVFRDCAVAEFHPNGDLARKSFHASFPVTGWRESPWLIVSSRFEPDYLGVPGLVSYLRTHAEEDGARLALYRTNLHYRWAAPWGNLVILTLAAPLGIVYSRRGVLGGVAGALVLFASVLFLTELLLALGKGGFLHPATAAWLTNAAFLAMGIHLFRQKARNREATWRWFRRG